MVNKDILVIFLKSLVESIENEKVSPDKLEKIGEFLMAYEFMDNSFENTDKDEIMKCLYLGYYIRNNHRVLK